MLRVRKAWDESQRPRLGKKTWFRAADAPARRLDSQVDCCLDNTVQEGKHEHILLFPVGRSAKARGSREQGCTKIGAAR